MDFIVRDKDNRNIPPRTHPLDCFKNFHLLLLSKRRCGFVQNQNLGPEINRTRNRQCLTLSARHGANSLCGIREIDADFQHFIMGNLVHFVHAKCPKACCQFTPHEKVARHAHQLVDRQILIHSADARRRCIAGIAKRRWLTFDIDRAASGFMHTR